LTDITQLCENNTFVFSLTVIHIACNRSDLMKNLQAKIKKRLVAAVLMIAVVGGVSALSIHAPTQKQNSLARALKSIQTDQATLFYADYRPDRSRCVEMVLPGTSESKAATENLKLIAAAL
jgi:hypothetical protein